ncbi:glycine cleavage system protein GcvH [Eubacteriales bacterium OttesenSCG-928-N14]|nr:glycine cleavage system protein GcvH [Eubacteriales bacterium OttesenSCG-928-N14]
MIPEDRKYTNEHEWVKADGDGYLIGITEHAQSELGDIVYVELPDVGSAFKAGEQFAVIESVKAVANVYCPFAGEVVAINEALDGAPESVNNAPYDAYLVRISAADANLDALMDAPAYQAFLEG